MRKPWQSSPVGNQWNQCQEKPRTLWFSVLKAMLIFFLPQHWYCLKLSDYNKPMFTCCRFNVKCQSVHSKQCNAVLNHWYFSVGEVWHEMEPHFWLDLVHLRTAPFIDVLLLISWECLGQIQGQQEADGMWVLLSACGILHHPPQVCIISTKAVQNLKFLLLSPKQCSWDKGTFQLLALYAMEGQILPCCSHSSQHQFFFCPCFSSLSLFQNF